MTECIELSFVFSDIRLSTNKLLINELNIYTNADRYQVALFQFENSNKIHLLKDTQGRLKIILKKKTWIALNQKISLIFALRGPSSPGVLLVGKIDYENLKSDLPKQENVVNVYSITDVY